MAGDLFMTHTKQLEFYQKNFPSSCLSFTVSTADKTKVPDLNYLVIEGLTFYVVQWELNIPDVVICCAECDDGVMIHNKFYFKHNGVATPTVLLSSNNI